MKILVVTSEVTFVPQNYNQFLDGLFSNLQGETDLTIELIILKNNSPSMILKGLALNFMGAKHIGFHLMKNSIVAMFRDRKKLAQKYNIKLSYFENPNNPDFHQYAKDFGVDLLVNARTRYIYKSKILKIPTIAAINIHHGLLPDKRGTMCDLWALNNDEPTGFTIHVMDKKIDNGSIIRRVQTTTNSEDPKGLRKRFSNLIFHGSQIEGVTMASEIKKIKKTRTIPIEMDNISTKPVYTKNPDFKSIRRMLQKGIEL